MYTVMKLSLIILVLPFLQGCASWEGKDCFLNDFVNVTKRVPFNDGPDWAGYNRDRQFGIAGPRSTYGIEPERGTFGPKWKSRMYKDPINGNYRPYNSYNEYIRSMQPKN